MKKASEYRQHAKECRTLANQAVTDEHRKQLSAMADTWDTLAREREEAAAKDAAAPSSYGSNGHGAGPNGAGDKHPSH